jgi:hypothetical protein
VARVTLNGRLIDDDFYSGRNFEIGLKRYAPEILNGDLRLEILALRKDAPIYIEPKNRPDFGKSDSLAEVQSVEIVSLTRAVAELSLHPPVTAETLSSTAVSESAAASNPYVAYLAGYMTSYDERHLYFAVSTNGFQFDQLVKGGQPILAATMDDKLVRDPMLFRDQQGVYHMVATISWKNRPFTMWDSTDLVQWTNERLVDVAPEGATKTWAPELAYDRAGDQYFAYWTAEVNNHWNTAAIYYATTKDFKTFSKPAVLYREPSNGILDADIVYEQGIYHLIYRFNGILEVTSTNAFGPYTNARQISPENVEGPFVFPLNDHSGWGLVWDYFGNSQGWGLFTSPDLKTWTRITNQGPPYYNEKVWFRASIRHGSVIPLTQEQIDVIKLESGVVPAANSKLTKT